MQDSMCSKKSHESTKQILAHVCQMDFHRERLVMYIFGESRSVQLNLQIQQDLKGTIFLFVNVFCVFLVDVRIANVLGSMTFLS